jgi:hypothetical protein
MNLNIRRTRAFGAGLVVLATTALLGTLGPVAPAHADETPTRATIVTFVDASRTPHDYRCDRTWLTGVLAPPPDNRGPNAHRCTFTKWFMEPDTVVGAADALLMETAIRAQAGVPDTTGIEWVNRPYSMSNPPVGTFQISFSRYRYEVRVADRYADGRTVEVFRGRAFITMLPNVRYVI